MNFLNWHYTKGVKLFRDGWFYLFGYLNHYFSMPLILLTLFSPWKKLIDVRSESGFDLKRIFEQFTFNVVSRGIGAVVRLILAFVWLALIIFTALFGALSFLIWLGIPFIGYFSYLNRTQDPEVYTEELVSKIKESKNKLRTVFDTDAGKFTARKVGLSVNDLVKNSIKETIEFEALNNPKTFEAIIDYLVKNNFWAEKFYRLNGLVPEDLVNASKWWDELQKQKNFREKSYGKSGLGLELVFGYTPTLNKFSSDLSSPGSFSNRLIGREDTVKRIERVLTAGANVCLVGDPGVGKKTIVLEFAHRAAYGMLGQKMAYKRILEFDYNFLLSESVDTNQKKTMLTQILNEAANAGNVILMIRDIQRLTNSEVEGYDFTDVFEKVLTNSEMKIITVSTPVEYERFIAPNSRLHKYFEKIEATQPTKELAMEIAIEWSLNWERKTDIDILTPSLRKIIDQSDSLITDTPFPEKALELLDSAVIYKQEKQEGNVLTPKDVSDVISEKTGVSLARLNKEELTKLDKLEDLIHERLIGQDEAVNMISKSLRARVLDISDRQKPIGSFLFLGPTGVGKTETAKVLAKVYYGSTDSIIRFDMAEYSGREGLERLIGLSASGRPGELTTAIKNKPASLLLLDELEKSPREVFNIFLTLLDEGYVTDALGRKISARHTFVIGTSNAGANYIRELVQKGVKGEELQKKLIDYIQKENIFSPEFLNRFDGVIVYEPLENSELVQIAKILFDELSVRLKKKGIILKASDDAIEKIANEGFDPAFGARPMRRILDLAIGDLISKSIISNEISDGDNVLIKAGEQKNEYRLEKV